MDDRLQRGSERGAQRLGALLLIVSALSAAARADDAAPEPPYRIVADDYAASIVLLGRLAPFHGFLVERFALNPAPPGVVRLFADRDALRAYGRAHVAGFDDAWAGGYDHASREVLLFPLDDGGAVARHEAVHQAMHAACADEPTWPRWFAEGLADFCARGRVIDGAYRLDGAIDRRDRDRVREQIAQRASAPLSALLVDRGAWRGEADAARYAQAYTLVWFLARAAEDDLRRRFDDHLKRLIGGAAYDDAWRAAFAGVPPAALESRWKAWLLRAP